MSLAILNCIDKDAFVTRDPFIWILASVQCLLLFAIFFLKKEINGQKKRDPNSLQFIT